MTMAMPAGWLSCASSSTIHTSSIELCWRSQTRPRAWRPSAHYSYVLLDDMFLLAWSSFIQFLNDMYLIQTLLASLWFSFYFNSLVVQGRFLLLLLLYPTLLIRTVVKNISSRRQGRWNNCPRKTTCLHFRKEWRRVSLENIFFPKIWS